MSLGNDFGVVLEGLQQDGADELVNGNELFSKDSSQNVPMKEERVIKKAKRFVKISPRKDSDSDNSVSSPPINGVPFPFTKNSRKSRNGDRTRGLPKKGGAGGKGTWGAPGSEIFVSGVCQDAHDPNYDSDSQDKYVIATVKPELLKGDLVKSVEPILLEYLEHGDAKEAKALLCDLNLGTYKRQVLEMAVNLALDRHDPQRELTSRLVRSLHEDILHTQDISKGFDSLLASLSDLTLDTPSAPQVLGQFIARAIADECLPADFIDNYKGKVETEHTKGALEKAEVLVSALHHGLAKMDNVWGTGGGTIPVKYLTNKMVLLLQEYLSSGDVAEATRCLLELDVPHFSHELVYQAAILAIEQSSDRASDCIVRLLKSFSTSNVITPDQFRKGVKRVFADMPEICLDVPSAYALLERLGNKLHAEGIMAEDLHKEMPVRGRKRFVSEGDGGKIKETNHML